MNPLSGIYGAATALHNSLFDHGVLRTRRLMRPVVSVGNLSAGGSGKTPFVIALGELLKQREITFDVLSRGYRRKTRGVLMVDPGGGASDFGDEPLLIARRLGVAVFVGERRYEAGRAAEVEFPSQLHILDDGFQHRSLARDLDIVLMTAEDFGDTLLPSGRLREPLSSLRRADMVVLPEGLDARHLLLRGKAIWQMRREIHIGGCGEGLIAFCGIARPKQFFAQVRAAGITPAAEIAYRDHHAYSANDVERLLALRHERGATGFLTTEKDDINLGELRKQLEPLAVAKLTLTIDHASDFVDAVLARIDLGKPRS